MVFDNLVGYTGYHIIDSFKNQNSGMFLDYFALVILFFVAFTLFYGVIAIHDIPYEIAARRNHPHQDAIHIAGWVSLFTLHILWPFLWIWATLWREDRGWGFAQIKDEQLVLHHKVLELEEQIKAMRAEIRALGTNTEAGDSQTTKPEKSDTAREREG
jgi:hypothetical protein